MYLEQQRLEWEKKELQERVGEASGNQDRVVSPQHSEESGLGGVGTMRKQRVWKRAGSWTPMNAFMAEKWSLIFGHFWIGHAYLPPSQNALRLFDPGTMEMSYMC